MGNKVEVYKWVADGDGFYDFEIVYLGESLIKGLLKAWKAKRAGVGMVKIEWR